MQAMTVEDVGADGVCIAIADGMKAAAYARKLDAAEAANDMLTAENAALKNELAAMEAENARLNRENRNHRFANERAIQNTLEMREQGVDVDRFRRLQKWVIYLFGIATGLSIAFAITKAFGV